MITDPWVEPPRLPFLLPDASNASEKSPIVSSRTTCLRLSGIVNCIALLYIHDTQLFIDSFIIMIKYYVHACVCVYIYDLHLLSATICICIYAIVMLWESNGRQMDLLRKVCILCSLSG